MLFPRTFLPFVLAAGFFVGCGSMRTEVKVKVVKGRGGATNNNEVTNLVGKTWFQTRESVAITFEKDLLIPGDIYSLTNASNNKQLINQSVVGAGLDDDAAVLAVADSYVVQIKFFPGEDGYYEDFEYGSNNLNLSITRAGKTYQRNTTLNLNDFDAQGISSIGFDNNTAVQDGFHSWLNPSTTVNALPYGKSDGTFLTTGYFNIINPSEN